jgi:tripartite-type tricarboxylate transporter receptor subunit TctC
MYWTDIQSAVTLTRQAVPATMRAKPMTDYSRFRAETFRTEPGVREYQGAPQVDLIFRLADWWLRRHERSAHAAREVRSTFTGGGPSIVRPMRWASLAAIGLAATALAAEAQEWPAKPLTAVIPFAAGSVTDVVPRIVFEQLSKQLGQNIIVENRSGAGGTTAATQVARSEPDGYTILVNSSAHTIAPALYPKVTYDAARDFIAVAPLGIVPSIVVVPPDRGFKTLADFIAAAKHKPGAMNFASAGVGTATHLGAVRFQLSAGVRAAHVPFKGGPESMGEVIAGRIDYFLAPVGVALSHVKDGKLMALAVNAPKRIAALPEVPTMSEAGLVNAEYQFWIGMFLPAKTPRSIVDKLERETFKALASQSVKDKLASLSIEPMAMTSALFGAYVEKEIVADAALVKAAGIKAQH